MKLTKNLLLLIFFIFGITSMIYQISWQRLLTLYYGVGHISTTIIVSVFMFGLGFGAIIGGKLVDNSKNRIRLLYIIGFLISFFGFISLRMMNFIGSFTAGSDYWITFFFIFIYLSVPTFLIGTVFPIIFRIINDMHPNFLTNISFIYFLNTMGSAFGSIISAFILISFFGIKITVYIAACLNLILAIVIFIISFIEPPIKKHQHLSKSSKTQLTKSRININLACILLFISGFMALGYEVIWLRLFRILTISSSYSFALTLFVFLFAIALGSFSIKKLIYKFPRLNNKSLFFLFQFIITGFVVFSFSIFFYLVKYTTFSNLLRIPKCILLSPSETSLTLDMLRNLPLFSVHLTEMVGPKISIFLAQFYINFNPLFWPVIFVSVPAFFMGASFPLIASLVKKKDYAGEVIGKLYFFNILGNILGGLITGFLLFSYFKTIGSIFIFFVMGIFFLVLVDFSHFFRKISCKIVTIVKYFVIVVLFITTIIFLPSNDDFYSEIYIQQQSRGRDINIINVEEDVDSVSVSFLYESGEYYHFNDGIVMGLRPYGHTYFQTINELSFSPKSEDLDILIIGFGGGTTVETILMLNNTNSITCVELSKSIIKTSMKFNEIRRILEDPRLNLVIDDGRRFLHSTNQTYDIILVNDPLRETRENSNNLYSKEFYELLQKHLSDKGIVGLFSSREHDIYPNTIKNAFRYFEYTKYYVVASNHPIKRNMDFYNTTLLSILNYYDSEISREVSYNDIGVIFNQDTFQTNTTKYLTDYTPWLEFYFWKIANKNSKLLIHNWC